jgi:hypothetical protein
LLRDAVPAMLTVMDALPLWALFAATVVFVLGSVELGHAIGTWRHRQSSHEAESAASPMSGATVALLGFMLAFTFSAASSRFDARRQVVLEEANAIGTAYLRTDLLPAEQRARSRELFVEYVDRRIAGVRGDDVRAVIADSERIQGELWSMATGALNAQPQSEAIARYVEALNAVIDVHSKRVQAGVRSRIPGPIWIGLYLLTAFAMGAIGYSAGLSGTARTPAVLPLAIAFALVLSLISALERPQRSVLSIDQYPMESLRRGMQPAAE